MSLLLEVDTGNVLTMWYVVLHLNRGLVIFVLISLVRMVICSDVGRLDNYFILLVLFLLTLIYGYTWSRLFTVISSKNTTQ